MEENKFNFQGKNSELKIKVKGFFKESDGLAYIKEYTNQIRKINPSNMNLVLDCTELSVTKQDLMPMLKSCFESYKKDNFKKVTTIVTEKNQAVLAMQLKTLSNKVGLKNFDLVKVK